jgi:hypothetical protein
MRTSIVSLWGLFAMLACGCQPDHGEGPLWSGGTTASPAPASDMEIEVPPPPFTEGVFPCSDCHDPEIPVNARRRAMKTAHQEIVIEHDQEHRWCLDCHSAENRDKLHLASGELVDFTESYRLCGQCHGDKYRDWRAGAHGRRSGNWDGKKTYLLCVNCHNAHAPAFRPLKPKPAPRRPQRADQPLDAPAESASQEGAHQ